MLRYLCLFTAARAYLVRGRPALDDVPDARARRIIGLMLDELRDVRVLPLQLPMPGNDDQLSSLCQALARDPASSRSLEEWSGQFNVSSKTLGRRFAAQTGLTFGAWRQQACLSKRSCG